MIILSSLDQGTTIITLEQKRLTIYIAAAATAGMLTAWFLALPFPNFLLYRTPPVEADAVVLFLGSADKARQKQVEELAAKGWAKFVIVPARGEIFEARVSQTLVTPKTATAMARGIKIDLQRAWVEQTDIEMRQAQALMKHIEIDAAIFVSSPYHMRRLKIMAGRTFDADKYKLAFVPTAYDPPRTPWFASWTDVKWVVSEYLKIIWYLLYSPFA